jgi:hypothetical protein
MKADVEAGLQEENVTAYSYDYLHKTLMNLLTSEGMDPNAETVTTARLRAIIDGERGRLDRVASWNARQSK